ncbi:hypothetical protein BaRGS_00037044 [Batillaria attramentaria]|uniref:Methyltransferase type 12 domain-containing protein n=1 Tax=Batillaria attramentaria TaxID=370345 RepID=A0ABD0JA43_9CAEN
MKVLLRSTFARECFCPVLKLLCTSVRQKSSGRTLKLPTWRQSQNEDTNHSKFLTSENKLMADDSHSQTDVPAAEGGDASSTRKAPFGTRYLTDPKNVFQHNAWDNVVWDEEQEAEARQTTQEQLQHAVSAEKQEEYEKEADIYWDKFYNQHQNRFFKDRHWLFIEFPELYSPNGKAATTTSDSGTKGKDSTPTKADAASTGVTQSADREDTGVATVEKYVSHPEATGTLTSQADQPAVSPLQLPHTTLCENQNRIDRNRRCVEQEGSNCISGVTKALDSVTVNTSSSAATPSSSGEFPGASATFRLLEVGCGVGNTVFPVLSTNNDPGLMMYCCDFSATAVQLVKEHPDYNPHRCHAFVWDITDDKAPLPFPPESLDIIILIFVLSAVHPDKMQQAVNRLADCLKPGGQLLFRDYGRYDLAQLRFKKGRCLSENFYVRGDGTRVYFFTQEELQSMFTAAGLEEVQNLVDRRLQVNRGRQIKMYRVWVQCKYRKPLSLTHQQAEVPNSASS